MKKSIILLAVVSASLVSCSKIEESRPEVKSGIPMSISVSLSDLTKTTTVDEGSVLKSTWDAEESISIITLDASKNGTVLEIDNFTSKGAAGRSSANFTGTFNGGDNPVKVIAVYPALEKDGDTYRTKPYKSNEGTSSILSGIKTYKKNLRIKVDYPPYQEGGCKHLKDYCVMVGKVDTKDLMRGKLSASLRHLMMVIKVTATFPDAYKGGQIERVSLTHGSRFPFLFDTSAYADLDDFRFSGIMSPGMGTSVPVNMVIPASGVVTVYIPCNPIGGDIRRDEWTFVASVKDKSNYRLTKKLTGDVTYEAGKMYRMDFRPGW